ncbi:MAG: M2 family metallopeptidase [Verrucomicrobiales bacterium]|nr:M2 family metallopeptidase [Verrucomicrobiales bacterium]
MRFRPWLALVLWVLLLPVHAASPLQKRADRFLVLVNAGYQALYRVESEAQWNASTDVKPEHDAAAEVAGRARAAFNGNPAILREARELLSRRRSLSETTVRQLERILLNAAEGPMTNPDLVAERIAAETAQASAMNGFQFRFRGTNVTANDIDRVLSTSRDLGERREVWEASKEIGPRLKDGLVRLRDLRNGVARELGHSNYFALQVAAYGMTTDEMVRLNEAFMTELRPLYRHLHTWVKHELARRYGQPVPKLIPAHWIDNRWSQEWGGLVEGIDLDAYFARHDPSWITKTAEQFYTGLGFPALPVTFWTRSDLFPVPPGQSRQKNAHASCWHIDLEQDIRSLMSVEANRWWFETAHHELGHAYYDLAYSRPEVPYLLRTSANPAFHEGIGELIGMASMQIPYLQARQILPAEFKGDSLHVLLNDALSHSVPFLFWGSGPMTHWEADIYAGGLPVERWNSRWWEYVREFQGVEPPAERGDTWCDPATKTHVNDAPCYYPNYAVATVLKFQFHDHIARRILHQPPQSCNYAGNREIGTWLRRMLEKGATEDWRKVLRDATGEDLSTRAMLAYYQPLLRWLEEQNRGRQIGWD